MLVFHSTPAEGARNAVETGRTSFLQVLQFSFHSTKTLLYHKCVCGCECPMTAGISHSSQPWKEIICQRWSVKMWYYCHLLSPYSAGNYFHNSAILVNTQNWPFFYYQLLLTLCRIRNCNGVHFYSWVYPKAYLLQPEPLVLEEQCSVGGGWNSLEQLKDFFRNQSLWHGINCYFLFQWYRHRNDGFV